MTSYYLYNIRHFWMTLSSSSKETPGTVNSCCALSGIPAFQLEELWSNHGVFRHLVAKPDRNQFEFNHKFFLSLSMLVAWTDFYHSSQWVITRVRVWVRITITIGIRNTIRIRIRIRIRVRIWIWFRDRISLLGQFLQPNKEFASALILVSIEVNKKGVARKRTSTAESEEEPINSRQ